MTRTDKGHFAAKHPPDTKVEPRIAQAVSEKMRAGKITCAAAHGIAAELAVPPLQVGIAIDLQDGRIVKCQLGLFGHDEGKLVQTPREVDQALAESITAVAQDGRLTCAAAWELARTLGKTRREVADTCEALQVRIVRCQLGAFG